MRFVIQSSKDGQFYFVLKARNGEVIATSEMYKSKQACKNGLKAVRRIALFASIVDLTK